MTPEERNQIIEAARARLVERMAQRTSPDVPLTLIKDVLGVGKAEDAGNNKDTITREERAREGGMEI